MKDLFRVRLLLGLSLFSLDERRLLYEACLYAGKEARRLPHKKFLCSVLDGYKKLPQSVGKRARLNKLRKKVIEITKDFHRA